MGSGSNTAGGAGTRLTRREALGDAGLAAVLGAAAGVSLYIGGDPALFGEQAGYSRPVGIAVVALIVGPIALGRRYPLACLAVATAAYAPLALYEIPEQGIAPVAYFIVLYRAGAYGGSRRDLVRGIAAVVIGALVVHRLASTGDEYEGRVPLEVVQGFIAFQNVFYLAAAWWLGDLVRNRREREATLTVQAEALRAAQAERERQAVREERVRIARELHDVVAHHVSVMGVQAGAARRVLAHRPEAVPDLLASIESSSREAVTDLHRTLRLLRSDDDTDPAGGGTDPQPTLARLDVLVDQVREAGLAVSLRTEGDGGVEGLPAGVDLSAYRIVQEALTNTLKHARAAGATVAVTRRPRSLEVVVSDDGAATPPPGATDGGLGIVGMRERVAALGGELKAGRGARGGFEVRAWLPLPEPAANNGGRP